ASDARSRQHLLEPFALRCGFVCFFAGGTREFLTCHVVLPSWGGPPAAGAKAWSQQKSGVMRAARRRCRLVKRKASNKDGIDQLGCPPGEPPSEAATDREGGVNSP